MKIEIKEKIYFITEKDESGLIPSEAISALISYQNGEPEGIYFTPKVKHPSNSLPIGEWHEKMIKYNQKCERISRKINPQRTREQVMQIVNRLEASLTK